MEKGRKRGGICGSRRICKLIGSNFTYYLKEVHGKLVFTMI